MNGENFKALLRPYNISAEEGKQLNERLGGVSVDGVKRTVAEASIAVVETKSGVLLTHVSMMIAITGIMLSINEFNSVLNAILTIEMVAYLVLALLCIRCQYQFDTKDFSGLAEKRPNNNVETIRQQFRSILDGELIYRERIFRFVLKTLYILTALLVITLVFSLFSGT